MVGSAVCYTVVIFHYVVPGFHLEIISSPHQYRHNLWEYLLPSIWSSPRSQMNVCKKDFNLMFVSYILLQESNTHACEQWHKKHGQNHPLVLKTTMTIYSEHFREVCCGLCRCVIWMWNSVSSRSLKSTRCCTGTIYTLCGRPRTCLKINFWAVRVATSTRDNFIWQPFDETIPSRFP